MGKMRHGKGNGGELGEERDDVHMRDESGSESDEEQEAPAGRGGPETVLAKEKLLRGALRSVSRGMDDSFSCLYQLALAYFRGQMYGRAKEAVGRALERLRKARSTRGHVAEKRFAALEAKMISLHAQCCMYEQHTVEEKTDEAAKEAAGEANGDKSKAAEGAQQEDPVEIQTRLVEATKVDNMQPHIWNNIGLLYMSLEKFEGAKAVLQPILANFHEYNDAMSNLGLCCMCQDELDEAAANLQTVILRDSSHVEALSNYGVLLLRHQQYAAAAVFLERAIDMDLGQSYVWSNLACAYSGEGRHADAAKAFKHARELDETNVAVTCNLAHHIAATIQAEGDAVARGVKLAQAEKMYSSVLCDEAESVQAWTGLAALFKVQTELAEGDEKRAELRALSLEAFSQALDANAADPVVWTQVGLLNLTEGDYKRAEMCFRSGIQHSPNILSAWCNLGVALQLAGSTNEAILMYAKALASFANSHEIYNNMGNLYRQLGKLEEAQTAFSTCLRLQPEYALGHNNLALVHIVQGRYAEARKSLQEAVALDPSLDAAKSNLLKLNFMLDPANGPALAAAAAAAAAQDQLLGATPAAPA